MLLNLKKKEKKIECQEIELKNIKIFSFMQSNSCFKSVLRSRSRSRKEPHLLVGVGAGSGAVTRCGSGSGSGSDGSGSDNGIDRG
jgi:hypothetical protein